MRFMFKVNISVEAGNEAARRGELGPKIQAILEEQKPESIYFLADNGERTAVFVIEMNDASDIPRIAEPWFLAFDAALEVQPVMTPADLAKAAPHIDAAVKKHG
ncbi:MAG: DUF3303 family protein [Candidatus Dadabacteria bacterium]|nr:DUF3303 family protein [Candidatus Dadabacteria bacterium]